jgi:hypothetical protein
MLIANSQFLKAANSRQSPVLMRPELALGLPVVVLLRLWDLFLSLGGLSSRRRATLRAVAVSGPVTDLACRRRRSIMFGTIFAISPFLPGGIPGLSRTALLVLPDLIVNLFRALAV